MQGGGFFSPPFNAAGIPLSFRHFSGVFPAFVLYVLPIARRAIPCQPPAGRAVCTKCTKRMERISVLHAFRLAVRH